MGRPLMFLVMALLVLAALAAAFIYSGFYNIGADAPHSRLVFGVLEELRERSISTRAQSIAVPADLNSPERIRAGAGLYAEMCTACHLGPGIEPTEISQGLYPPAPQFARGDDL